MMKRINFFVKGFTLIEILIALFVFSILSLILAGALRSIINFQSGTEKNAERLRQLQLALLVLSRDIEQAINRPILNASGKEEAAFLGDAKGFTFTHAGFANPTSALLRSSLQRTAYHYHDNSLFRTTWEVLDQAPTSKPHPRKLLNNVLSAHFKYLDKKGKFHYTWPPEEDNQQEILPRALSIELTLSDWGKINQLYVISADQPKLRQLSLPST